jgi:hypothetical protein
LTQLTTLTDIIDNHSTAGVESATELIGTAIATLQRQMEVRKMKVTEVQRARWKLRCNGETWLTAVSAMSRSGSIYVRDFRVKATPLPEQTKALIRKVARLEKEGK